MKTITPEASTKMFNDVKLAIVEERMEQERKDRVAELLSSLSEPIIKKANPNPIPEVPLVVKLDLKPVEKYVDEEPPAMDLLAQCVKAWQEQEEEEELLDGVARRRLKIAEKEVADKARKAEEDEMKGKRERNEKLVCYGAEVVITTAVGTGTGAAVSGIVGTTLLTSLGVGAGVGATVGVVDCLVRPIKSEDDYRLLGARAVGFNARRMFEMFKRGITKTEEVK